MTSHSSRNKFITSPWVKARAGTVHAAVCTASPDLGDRVPADRDRCTEDCDGNAYGYPHASNPYASTHMPDRTVPSIVDGDIEPEDMCPGSESRAAQFCGPTLQCSTCDRWLPAYPGSFLDGAGAVSSWYRVAPVHKRP